MEKFHRYKPDLKKKKAPTCIQTNLLVQSVLGFCRLKCKRLWVLLCLITDLKGENINMLVIFADDNKLESQKNGEKPRKSGENLINEQMGWSTITNMLILCFCCSFKQRKALSC